MDAVATHNLRKRYGSHEALRGIDLRVPSGSLFGFLGPNGAGKTTAIRIMMGLLRPTGGDACVLGHDAWRDGPRLRREVGYLPGEVRFYPDRTGRQILDIVRAARGLRGGDEVRRLADRFNLDISRRVRAFSSGMKQKLGLIAAMLHRPPLLILDEPTTGLDPLVRQTLFDELRTVSARGGTVLFSSHTLSEVAELCSHVAVLREGRLVEQDRIDVLRSRALRRVELTLAASPSVLTPPQGFRVEHQNARQIRGTWTGPVEPLLAWLSRIPVSDVIIAPPSLEDLFLAYYKDRGEGSAT